MKHRSALGKPEAKTAAVDYSSSLTIAEFESGKSAARRRVSFNSLISNSQINPEASSIISTNPLLATLNEHKLLFFSSEYRESTLSALQAYRISKATRRELSSDENYVNNIVLNSLHSFSTDYKTCSLLGQDFLNTSTKILTAKPTDFAGLSIEAIPHYDGETRSDHYDYNKQQLNICFQPLKAPLSSHNKASLLLAHELTHAIDDVHSNLNSCKVLFNNLHKNASGNRQKQKAILDCAAKIVDDKHHTFEALYLPALKDQWFVEGRRKVFYDRAQEWVDARAEAPATNVFVGVEDGKRGLKCGSVPTEFLTFSMEHVFNALKESENPNEFADKYNTSITKAISKVDENGFELEIKKAALELIKDTTTHHLKLLHDNSTDYPEFKQCCNTAIDVLETKYAELGDPSVAVARRTATPSEFQALGSKEITRKRDYSPIDSKDERNEKKVTTEDYKKEETKDHTAEGARGLPDSAATSASRKSHSKSQILTETPDDGNGTLNVKKMIKSFSDQSFFRTSIHHTPPACKTTRTRPRSNSIS